MFVLGAIIYTYSTSMCKCLLFELLFYHRDSENTEKNREGILSLSMSYDYIKNKYKAKE